jgi:hypothetical protein
MAPCSGVATPIAVLAFKINRFPLLDSVISSKMASMISVVDTGLMINGRPFGMKQEDVLMVFKIYIVLFASL